MARSLVSVIITAYRSGPYLAETIESALAQTLGDREIVVVDDGTPDASVQRIVARHPGVRYLRQRNAGGGIARNTGVRATSSEYVAFLDHDDLWRPDKLAVQLEVARRHPESGLIACDGDGFDGERILRSRLVDGPLAARLDAAPDGELTGFFYREFVPANPIACPAQTLIPRRVIERIGPQTSNWPFAADADYWLRIAGAYPVTLHRDALARYRYLPSSLSGPRDLRRARWELRRARLLGHHLRRHVPPGERGFAVATLRAHLLGAARVAYLRSRRRERGPVWAQFARLLPFVRHQPAIVLYLLAAGLPEAVVDALARITRRLQVGAEIARR